jgi:hypothetical protein
MIVRMKNSYFYIKLTGLETVKNIYGYKKAIYSNW